MEAEIDSGNEVKPSVAVEEDGNCLGSDVPNGDGGEDRRGVRNGKTDTVQGGIVGSVPGAGLSVRKPLYEMRFTTPSSEPNTPTMSPTQLTIFYAGSVSVFDGIPSEKVHEILRIAAAATVKSAETKNGISMNPAPSPALTRSPSFSSTSTVASPGAQPYPMQPNSFCRLAADLPIARRHSLQRFLEKRRDRLVNRNPYSTPPATKKTDDSTKTNLGTEGCMEKNPVSVEGNQPKACN